MITRAFVLSLVWWTLSADCFAQAAPPRPVISAEDWWSEIVLTWTSSGPTVTHYQLDTAPPVGGFMGGATDAPYTRAYNGPDQTWTFSSGYGFAASAFVGRYRVRACNGNVCSAYSNGDVCFDARTSTECNYTDELSPAVTAANARSVLTVWRTFIDNVSAGAYEAALTQVSESSRDRFRGYFAQASALAPTNLIVRVDVVSISSTSAKVAVVARDSATGEERMYMALFDRDGQSNWRLSSM